MPRGKPGEITWTLYPLTKYSGRGVYTLRCVACRKVIRKGEMIRRGPRHPDEVQLVVHDSCVGDIP